MYIGHRKEFLKLTIRASALRQSPKNESSFNGHCYQADADTEIEPFCHPDRVVRGTFISTDIYIFYVLGNLRYHMAKQSHQARWETHVKAQSIAQEKCNRYPRTCLYRFHYHLPFIAKLIASRKFPS